MPNLQYYVTGNTARGLANFLESNLIGIDQVIKLKHPSASLKTKVIQNLLEYYHDNAIEVLHSPLGSRHLDGIIIREESLAFLDETIVKNNSTAINLEEAVPIKRHSDLTDFNVLTQSAYDSFAKGLSIHDELEEVYINQMDFNHADQFTEEFISTLLTGVSKKDRTAHTFHRLFGTNTVDGVVNVVPHLKGNITNVFFIKGRAGTGKSTFMKKITEACTECGFDVEMYHCSFDPDSIDMVLVRDLDVCIFDSTDPHEFFPVRDGERIVDLYEELVTPGTDERFETEINVLNNNYKSYMKQGIQYLQQAGIKFEKSNQNFSDSDVQRAVQYTLNSI
ncbi:hypothetical protein [Virgibacillus litoralis]|uniref:ATPase n=1 Tax=Virgibacillus litoralis TaxID=578221 RepID=A0ABS4HAS0_9BACI|nr:hypothetical protein [Virgibacillus litoralis]MBP1948009.1 hypothetical protein [Virgibacillus litoralis]